MADFKQTHGNVDSGVSDERPNAEAGTPVTGFNDGPKGTQAPKGPGPGIRAGGTKIH